MSHPDYVDTANDDDRTYEPVTITEQALEQIEEFGAALKDAIETAMRNSSADVLTKREALVLNGGLRQALIDEVSPVLTRLAETYGWPTELYVDRTSVSVRGIWYAEIGGTEDHWVMVHVTTEGVSAWMSIEAGEYNESVMLPDGIQGELEAS